MRLKNLFLFLLTALALFVSSPERADAYDAEHYYWTYYVALHVGFTERQAWQIASATIAVDYSSETDPMPRGNLDTAIIARGAADEKRFRGKWRRFHAFVDMDAYHFELDRGADPRTALVEAKSLIEVHQDDLLELANQQRNPGIYLHFLQDRMPHGGWGDILGHAAAGHLPDYFAISKANAWQMTEDTIAALTDFKNHLCQGKSPDRHPYCQFKPVDRNRLNKVLDRMIESTPLPAGIRQYVSDPLGLVSDLKAEIRKVKTWDASAYTRLSSYSPGVAAFRSLQTYASGIGRVESIYASHGYLLGTVSNMAIVEDQPMRGYHNVVINAVYEDKLAGRLEFVGDEVGRRTEAVERIEEDLDPDLAFRWIKYIYNNDGQHILGTNIVHIEERELDITPAAEIKPTYRRVSGEGPAAIYEVAIEIPVVLTGTAPLYGAPVHGRVKEERDASGAIRIDADYEGVELLRRLPVVVESSAPGAARGSSDFISETVYVADKTDQEAPARGSTINSSLTPDGERIRVAIRRKAADLEDGSLRWRVDLHPYGFASWSGAFDLKVVPARVELTGFWESAFGCLEMVDETRGELTYTNGNPGDFRVKPRDPASRSIEFEWSNGADRGSGRLKHSGSGVGAELKGHFVVAGDSTQHAWNMTKVARCKTPKPSRCQEIKAQCAALDKSRISSLRRLLQRSVDLAENPRLRRQPGEEADLCRRANEYAEELRAFRSTIGSGCSCVEFGLWHTFRLHTACE